MVHLKSMLSYATWEKLCASRAWMELYPWLSIENAAMLWFRLRALDDTPENFPHGKWASIQQLDELITTAIKQKEKPDAK